ncbi:Hsp20/alpha crystallin family protein [Methanobacterium sp. ACI-7]|uniref:Hsp20/alpha crystallin family protein n=1 Tax=unclassified Methanobacterium TaxID=2627676 RepID=UPI0039C277DA
MEEKKVIKTRKELEMEEGGEKEIMMEKEVTTEADEPEVETETTTGTSATPMEKKIEKGRNTAQKIFEDMINTFRDRQGDFEKAMSEYTASSGKMAMDVVETENELIVKVDLPGVRKEDIVIDLTEDSLEVMAIFADESEFKGDNFLKKERKYGEAKRTINFSQMVKIEEATAKFDNGVLTVIIPKEEKKRHQLTLD